jgi:hypothetical protein
LATFAWKLIAGVLPTGKALGCKQAPEYDTVTGECLLCRIPGETDTIEHVFGSCCAMQPVHVRDWTALALAHVTGWAAPLGGELLHMVYGPVTDTPAGTVI